MTEERWKLLRERFIEQLNRPRAEGEDTEDYFDRVHLWLDAIEMSIEVKELRERVEAVNGVLRDNSPFGEPVDVDKIVKALHGS